LMRLHVTWGTHIAGDFRIGRIFKMRVAAEDERRPRGEMRSKIFNQRGWPPAMA